MFFLECLVLLSDLGILWFVYREYSESKETNRVLMQVLSKQKKQKRRVSVDRIVKAAMQGEGATN